MKIDKWYCILLMERSELAAHSIMILEGLIDSDYRCPVSAVLHNTTNEAVWIVRQHRVAQAHIIAVQAIMRTQAATLTTAYNIMNVSLCQHYIFICVEGEEVV